MRQSLLPDKMEPGGIELAQTEIKKQKAACQIIIINNKTNKKTKMKKSNYNLYLENLKCKFDW